jgi:hypothetical protein
MLQQPSVVRHGHQRRSTNGGATYVFEAFEIEEEDSVVAPRGLFDPPCCQPSDESQTQTSGASIPCWSMSDSNRDSNEDESKVFKDDDATVASSVATDLGTDPEEDQKPAARSPSLVFPAYLDYNSEEEDAIDHLPPWNPLPENSEEQEAIRRSVAAAIRSREEEEAVDRWERANQMLVECGLAPVYSPRYSRKKQRVAKNNSDSDSTLDTSFSSESISSESSSTPIKEAN